MSYTPVYIPVPVPTKPHVEPKCPHCEETLVGWLPPSDDSSSFKENFIGFSIVGFILIQILAGFIGMMEGSFNRCDPFFSKRFHYVAPTFPAVCAASRWLVNKEVIFREDQ